MFARRELLYLALELGPAFGPEMWTVKIELLRPINLDHDIVVERVRIFCLSVRMCFHRVVRRY